MPLTYRYATTAVHETLEELLATGQAPVYVVHFTQVEAIERAQALLRLGEMSVTEVCLEVGCTSLGSFSARFTQLVGQTPTAYRNRDHSRLASVPGCIAKDLTRPRPQPSRIREANQAAASLPLRA